MSRTCSRALSPLLLAILLFGAASASAEETGGAAKTSTAASGGELDEHLQAGKAAYLKKDYELAVAEWKKAFEIKAEANLAYNIARAYEKLSQWKDAIAWYEQFLKLAPPSEHEDALRALKYLKERMGGGGGTPTDQAKDAGRLGAEAYRAGDYERAIAEWRRGYDLQPDPVLLYNIARAFERLVRYEEAIDMYKQFLDEAPTAPERREVQENIRRLEKAIKERYQELQVSSEPPGADIYLDDRTTGLQGQTNFRFKVTPGPHTLYLDLNGYEPVKRDFVMPDDKPLTLEFQMKKLENVGYLTITVNVDGARIFVDGAIVGLSPYTVKKALTAGTHQIQIEAKGFPRYTQAFVIERDKTNDLKINLEKAPERVKDETLTRWGRNLVIIGIIGGGLGIAGPFAFQKLIERRPLYTQLGPKDVAWGPDLAAGETPHFWQGTPKDPNGVPKKEFTEQELAADGNFRSNSSVGTLRGIQIGAAIGGGVLVAGGLGLYIWKWSRADEPEGEIVTSAIEEDRKRPVVSIESFGLAPTPDGAAVGLSGSF